MIRGLSAEALEELIRTESEKDYLVVDVRQAGEYRLDHIPGSVNVPLADIQFDPYMFETGRKLIFCCTRGVRSKVAAIFVADAGHAEENLYHLRDGLYEYSGEILLDMPRVDRFPRNAGPHAILETAVNFEKGAFRFYQMAKEQLTGTDLLAVIEKMSGDEIGHARSIFNEMQKIRASETDFKTYFDRCTGDILEGGKYFEEIEAVIRDPDGNTCMDILDFAVELEYSAYDLYKTMAENIEMPEVKAMFLRLSQAEKKHLDQLILALDLCTE